LDNRLGPYSFYSGWLGQKGCSLTHAAVFWDRSDLWSAAAAEVDRLVLVSHDASEAGCFDLSGEIGVALGKLVGCFADGGWWTSAEGTRERAAHHDERRELEQFPDHEPDPGGTPFHPRLALECDPVYPVAATAISALDTALMQTASAMKALDVCRLGVLLSGFCYRSTPRLDIRFINSILNDLAARDMTALQAENELRRAIGLSEIAQDRRPQSISDPVPVPPPPPTRKHGPSRDVRDPFQPSVGMLVDQRDLVLACVFRRFGVRVPPAEIDASLYPELPAMKMDLRARVMLPTTGDDASSTPSTKAAEDQGRAELSEQTEFWAGEAITYLGLDRLDLKRPDMALQRLIKREHCGPRKSVDGSSSRRQTLTVSAKEGTKRVEGEDPEKMKNNLHSAAILRRITRRNYGDYLLIKHKPLISQGLV